MKQYAWAYRDTTDTLFLSEWLLQYQQAYKELDQLPGQLRLLNKQINYSKRQLNNLKADAERGKIRPEEIDTFLIQGRKTRRETARAGRYDPENTPECP